MGRSASAAHFPLVVTQTRSGESTRTMSADHTTVSKNPTTRSGEVWFPGKGKQGQSACALYSPHRARQVPSQVQYLGVVRKPPAKLFCYLRPCKKTFT